MTQKYTITRSTMADPAYYMHHMVSDHFSIADKVPDPYKLDYDMRRALAQIGEFPDYRAWLSNRFLPILAEALDRSHVSGGDFYIHMGAANPDRRTTTGWMNSIPLTIQTAEEAGVAVGGWSLYVGNSLTLFSKSQLDKRIEDLLSVSPWLSTLEASVPFYDSDYRVTAYINPDHYKLAPRVEATLSPITNVRAARLQAGEYYFTREGTITTVTSDDQLFVRLSNLDNVGEAYIDAKVQNAKDSYRQTVLSRLGRNLQFDAEAERRAKETRRAHASAKFGQFRDKRDRQVEDRTHDLFATLPFVVQGVASSARWGIEVETGAAQGIPAPSGWGRKYDGSLSPADSDEYYDDCDEEDYCDCGCQGESDNSGLGACAEFVSPILTSMHSSGLKRITDQLEGRPTTYTAGIHVHVEASDLNAKQVAELVASYDLIEGIIENSYQREEREYCKRRYDNDILNVVRYGKDNPAKRGMDVPYGDRYVTVNILSLQDHGTIEFRAMGPVYNYDYLVRWAMFCREMVNTIRGGATRKEWGRVRDFDGIQKMFQRFGIEYNLAAGLNEPVIQPELVAV